MTSILAPTASAIVQAAHRLHDGGLVVIPTETVYGLAADASRQTPVQAIFALKGRPADHPLIVHVADVSVAQRWGQMDDRARALAQAFWPGPLTLIVPRQPDAPPWAAAGQPSIGLRCPSHPVAQAVLRAFAQRDPWGGLAAPSANRFGRVSPTCAQHVLDDLAQDTPMLLDGGPCEVGVESTIVDLTSPRARLLRPGRIRREAIEAVLGTSLADRDDDAPRASGTLASHYCPVTALRVVGELALDEALRAIRQAGVVQQDRDRDWDRAGSSATPAGRIGVFSRERPSDPSVLWLQAPADVLGWEQALYDAMRRLDREALSLILIAVPGGSPHWDAILDRVSRAAVRD
jgi:L-threonylcarbamoyladenylate synthase